MWWLPLLPLLQACSFGASGGTEKSPPLPPDNLCRLYQPQCSELADSHWLRVEDRCIFHLEAESETADEASELCAEHAPDGTKGRLLRVNTQEILTHFIQVGSNNGFAATYLVNGRRHVQRAAGAPSFLDDFRWKDENGVDIATMYFKPDGWGMREEYAGRAGDCVAITPLNEGGGVIYPTKCDGQLDAWCEFDCVLLESPLASP